MIYICGVTHDMQCLKEDNTQKALDFYEHVKTYCNEFDIQTIIEEYNDDAAIIANCLKVIAYCVAEELNIEHVYCEPSLETRESLNIDDVNNIRAQAFAYGWSDQDLHDTLERQFEIREQYWMDIICPFVPNDTVILFICGRDHVSRMAERFDDESIEYSIIE